MTLFEKIIKGDIPSYKVYEDDDFFAFLDNNPHSKGHTLIIPKEPYENLTEIPDEILGQFIKVVKDLAIRAQSTLDADGYNIVMNNGAIAGQEIFHAHIHMIPRYDGDVPIHSGRPDLGFTKDDFLEIQQKLSL